MKNIALAFVLVSGFAMTALADAPAAADQTTAPVPADEEAAAE
jgi:hypothetical protein